MKKLMFVSALIVGTTAMAKAGGDVGSMSLLKASAKATRTQKAQPVDFVTNPAYDKLTLCLEITEDGYSENRSGLNAEIGAINVDPTTQIATLDLPALRDFNHKIVSFGNTMRKNEWGHMAYIADVKIAPKQVIGEMSLHPEGGLSFWGSDGWTRACSGPVKKSECAKFDEQKVCVGDEVQVYADSGPSKISKIYSDKEGILAAFRLESDEADPRTHAEGRGDWVRIKMKFEGTVFKPHSGS